MIRRIFFFFAFTGLFSCKGPATFKDQKFDTFSIKVADFLVPINKPEVRSSAYFEDTINNCLFMVVRESKDTMIAYGQKSDLNSYFMKTSKSLYSQLSQENMQNVGPEEITNSYLDTINGSRAIIGRIAGHLGEEKLVYFLTTLETRKAFYQIIFGMPLDQEDRYTKPVHEMIESFREN